MILSLILMSGLISQNAISPETWNQTTPIIQSQHINLHILMNL